MNAELVSKQGGSFLFGCKARVRGGGVRFFEESLCPRVMTRAARKLSTKLLWLENVSLCS